MTFYEELFKDLDMKGVRYLVVGGVAVILHGFIRATADLDLMVALDEKNLHTFLDLIKSKGYRPKAPVPIDDFSDPEKRKSWVTEKGMKVFSLYHPQKLDELIDVFVEEQIPFSDAYSRKKVALLGTIPINVMQIPDLITLKKKAGRPQDLQDIIGLEHILKENK
ncbi:MAG: DUF6036 family nucleotidyltransferase [Elusimicrobiota bacterium]